MVSAHALLGHRFSRAAASIGGECRAEVRGNPPLRAALAFADLCSLCPLRRVGKVRLVRVRTKGSRVSPRMSASCAGAAADTVVVSTGTATPRDQIQQAFHDYLLRWLAAWIVRHGRKDGGLIHP